LDETTIGLPRSLFVLSRIDRRQSSIAFRSAADASKQQWLTER
jgi:hypothetical protein